MSTANRTIAIALAGNPNSGKTTLFNALTASNQYVGNWPGVTVEKKEGSLRQSLKQSLLQNSELNLAPSDKITIIDMPGIYSLSPYTLEEVVSRNYLTDEGPSAILNIVDATSLERGLYLTTQLVELGIPIVVALNMMDIVEKRSMTIDTQQLAHELGCRVVEISALKGSGIEEAIAAAIQVADQRPPFPQHGFSGIVEHALAHIEEAVLHGLPEEQQRWYAIKLFERDRQVIKKLGLSEENTKHIEHDIKRCEEEYEDDAESIITTERYAYIDHIVSGIYVKKRLDELSVSGKIDRVITNRFAALPIFAIVMFLVYFVAVSSLGAVASGWANEGLFGTGWYVGGVGAEAYYGELEAYETGLIDQEPNPADFGPWVPGAPTVIGDFLDAINCADWLQGLILDGILAGVGAIIGFVPQMFVLFFLLAFLEGCGYMARIAFILDRLFRRFGLSGKSFVPILIGTGCGVPGIMASRTIENIHDRRMTIITTTFIPCSAKLPIIALIAGALFGGAWWVAPSAYFIGIAAIICSGIILKKTRLFRGDVTPFIMELPAYHLPSLVSLLRSMWDRGWSFVKRAGTIILLGTIIIWFAANFGWSADGSFGMVEMNESILAYIGNAVAWLFNPLGWGDWRSAVAAITGLLAKENIVGTLGILYNFADVSENGGEIWSQLAVAYTPAAAYSFLVFNLLCAPCFAAIGAIRREMNNAKWFWIAIGYQCGFAYAAALCFYQISTLLAGGSVGLGTAVAFVLLIVFVYLLFRSENRRKLRGRG